MEKDQQQPLQQSPPPPFHEQPQRQHHHNQGSSSATSPGTMMPSAPPSYEEAVGLQSGMPIGAPYPMAGAPQMPIPGPFGQSAYQIPLPEDIRIQGVGYPPQAPSPGRYPNPPLIITEQPTSRGRNQRSGIVILGPNSVKLTCPSCHTDVKTTTMSDHQPGAHVCCIMLCLVGCCLCSCLPYCLKMFMNVHHFCPNCKSYIGTWST